MKRGFVFPGQGSQSVGMGQAMAEEFACAREVFERADAALSFELSKLCFEGPEEELQLTANTQPAILATSVACLAVLRERGIEPEVVAGHSLGEYSALVCASVLELEDALRLVRRRGELMQEAVPVGVGAMAAVLGLSSGDCEGLIAAQGSTPESVCEIANYNAPEQTVVAGHEAAVSAFAAAAEEAGARKVVMLPVSAPFHCSLMAPAREGLEPMLRDTEFRDPVVPVVCNVDAAPVSSGDDARDALLRQITGSVRWVKSVQRMIQDHTLEGLVEVGPGKVLSGLSRRIDRSVRCKPFSEAGHLETL